MGLLIQLGPTTSTNIKLTALQGKTRQLPKLVKSVWKGFRLIWNRHIPSEYRKSEGFSQPSEETINNYLRHQLCVIPCLVKHTPLIDSHRVKTINPRAMVGVPVDICQQGLSSFHTFTVSQTSAMKQRVKILVLSQSLPLASKMKIHLSAAFVLALPESRQAEQ